MAWINATAALPKLAPAETMVVQSKNIVAIWTDESQTLLEFVNGRVIAVKESVAYFLDRIPEDDGVMSWATPR